MAERTIAGILSGGLRPNDPRRFLIEAMLGAMHADGVVDQREQQAMEQQIAGHPLFQGLGANAARTLVELSTVPAFSVASRLYFIAELADRVAPFYHREATTHEPERLAHELAEIRRTEVQAELHARRGASSPLDGLALRTVMGLMHARLEAAPAFARIVAKAARTHAEAAGVGVIADPLRQLTEIGPERLWRTHMERRARLGAAQTQRLERYLERYCRSYWLQDWYPLSPTLLEHLMQLLVRVALLRFLLIAHPELGPDGDAAVTDRAAVEVFYATSRAYDHNQAVREMLSSTLGKRGMLTVGHAAALLKL